MVFQDHLASFFVPLSFRYVIRIAVLSRKLRDQNFEDLFCHRQLVHEP